MTPDLLPEWKRTLENELKAAQNVLANFASEFIKDASVIGHMDNIFHWQAVSVLHRAVLEIINRPTPVYVRLKEIRKELRQRCFDNLDTRYTSTTQGLHASSKRQVALSLYREFTAGEGES